MAGSTYTTNLKLELIPTGGQSGQWGSTTNVNLGSSSSTQSGVEQAIVGKATLPDADFVANVATYTLADTNATQKARAFCLEITATLSAAGTVNVPSINKPYLVFNNSVGGFAVTVKVTGIAGGVSVPSGKKTWVYTDTTNNVVAAIDYLPTLSLGTALAVLSGGTGTTTSTGTGSVVLSNTPTLVTPNLGTPNSATLTNATGLPLTTGVTGTLLTDKGGTGQSSYTAGDMTYYASGTALTKLPIGTSTFVLTSSGTAPQWVSPSTIPVGTATNLDGGSNGTIPYQSAPGTTQMLAAGTANYVLKANGAAAPTWVAQSTLAAGTATTATNLAGGATWRVPYQTGAGATTFLPAPTVAGTVILWNGTSVDWGLGPASSTAINLLGGSAGVVPYQTGSGVTSFTGVGSEGRVLTSHGTAAPTWEPGVTQADVNQTSIAFSLIFGG